MPVGLAVLLIWVALLVQQPTAILEDWVEAHDALSANVLCLLPILLDHPMPHIELASLVAALGCATNQPQCDGIGPTLAVLRHVDAAGGDLHALRDAARELRAGGREEADATRGLHFGHPLGPQGHGAIDAELEPLRELFEPPQETGHKLLPSGRGLQILLFDEVHARGALRPHLPAAPVPLEGRKDAELAVQVRPGLEVAEPDLGALGQAAGGGWRRGLQQGPRPARPGPDPAGSDLHEEDLAQVVGAREGQLRRVFHLQRWDVLAEERRQPDGHAHGQQHRGDVVLVHRVAAEEAAGPLIAARKRPHAKLRCELLLHGCILAINDTPKAEDPRMRAVKAVRRELCQCF
mmetsp:Transcript_107103/g.335101  ORF Transcript_107103/g.335101 Transcript_107103/m.335101 type:complete len:350 (-) Transcript_107103:595-1644(-)